MYKQIIIARKDLGMSHGKLAAQVAHGSMAFLLSKIKKNAFQLSNPLNYLTNFTINRDLYELWMNDKYTKCVLQAKNKNHLLKAKEMADELGMIEDKDYFLIWDSCYTELIPENEGKTLTVIGFKPMHSEIIDKIGKKYHLFM